MAVIPILMIPSLGWCKYAINDPMYTDNEMIDMMSMMVAMDGWGVLFFILIGYLVNILLK